MYILAILNLKYKKTSECLSILFMYHIYIKSNKYRLKKNLFNDTQRISE